MSQHPSVVLTHSGYTASVEPDEYVPGAYQLIVDGTPQSHVNLADPSQLFYEYIQRMGHVIDAMAPARRPITAVHLGAGALTLPRYIAATRPGSRQQVVEIESELVDLVRRELPLPKNAQIRVRHGDAREMLGKFPTGIRGHVDLLVVDIFSGSTTPAHVTSREFYASAAELLAPDGIMLVNVADGPPLAFARSQVATIRSVIGNLSAIAEPQVIKGRRFGNVVLVASAAPLELDWLPRLVNSGPYPARMLHGHELTDFAARAPITTDATATASPEPHRRIFYTTKR